MKHMNARMRYASRALGGRARAEMDMGAALTRAQEIKNSLRAKREELAGMAAKADYDPEAGRALRETIEREAQTYADLMQAVQTQEEQTAARVAGHANARMAQTARASRDALGGLYRALMVGGDVPAKIKNELSLPTTPAGSNGAYLLPKHVSDQLIADIAADTSILDAITVTQITGLSMPKIATTDAEGDDTDEGTAAVEATMTGGEIVFGRYPYRKSVTVPNSLLVDTNVALEAYITGKHTELMRARMCSRLFAATPAGNYIHMGVYRTTDAIKTATGDTLLAGIQAALADLPTMPQGVYKVALSMGDWMSLITLLANGATPLFAAPLREIIGFEPVICNYVTKPVVGDLSTIHLNYDTPIMYEAERKATMGTTSFVLSTHYDIQIEQPELLRVVTVGA